MTTFCAIRELAPIVWVLGCYPPAGSQSLPISIPTPPPLETLSQSLDLDAEEGGVLRADEKPARRRLKIGIIGFGNFGQFIAKTFAKEHDVFVTNREDKTAVTADIIGDPSHFTPWFDMQNFLAQGLDVVVIAVSILSFEEVVRSLPLHLLAGMLVVDVLSVKVRTAMRVRFESHLFRAAQGTSEDHAFEAPSYTEQHPLHPPDVRP